MGNADLDSQDGGKDKKKSFEEKKTYSSLSFVGYFFFII